MSAPLSKPGQSRIVVAMSGGVDSSVAAALLVEAGHDVIGVTLQLYDHGAAVGRKGACCAGSDIKDAARVAEVLGIPHYVLDFETRFRESVINDFVGSYLAGETPVPCIRCNETVKFRDLLAVARELGAGALATGHYVRRIEGASGPELHRAADAARDQSYFLFSMTREQLAFTRFPVGDRPKDDIRAIAARLGLPVADKPDSQDICFVPQGRYSDLVRKLGPKADPSGEIRDLAGRVLGRHEGIEHFTIGQRKGLGISSEAPLYVVKLDARTRAVIVGPREALITRRLRIGGVNWLGDMPLGETPQAVAVRVRSTRAPVEGSVRRLDAETAEVVLPGGEEGVAPGQACVFSEATTGSRILGGGWILGEAGAAKLDSLKACDLHPALRVAG